jgi:DNA-binding response OmpR family regulator
MTARSAADVLIAATDIDERLLECLADCRARLVRTFDEAQRALREQLFGIIVIDLNFDNVRMFDLLQHVRSLARFNGVPVLCIQRSEAGTGLGAALDRLVRTLGGKALVDLRGDGESFAGLFRRLRHRPLCVLIIDRDIDAAHRLGELLEDRGHDVDFAYDAMTGVDAARRLRPDVVFVGLELARLDGEELMRRLGREPRLNSARIIALGAERPSDWQSIQRLLEVPLELSPRRRSPS